MRRSDNPELKRKVLDHLCNLYNIKEVREPNHLSSYVYCRTKTFFDQKQTSKANDEEVMLFAIGYGLQDVLTPKDADAPLIDKEGILYRPDMVLSFRQNEIKTTRRSAKNHYIDEYIPQTWMDYMMGGCSLMGTKEYDLIVLYLMGNYSPPFPVLYCDTFYFDDAELEANWKKIIDHKEVLDKSLETDQLPTPYQNCYDWECHWCRYKLVCEAVAKVQNLPNPNLGEDTETDEQRQT